MKLPQSCTKICLGWDGRLNMSGMRCAVLFSEASRLPCGYGPPRIGKRVWVCSLTAALALPYKDIDASKGGAGMALVGVGRSCCASGPTYLSDAV